MSKISKRKRVIKEVLEDDFSPPTANQTIVRIISSRGNNLHLVAAPDDSRFLVSMPTKFRKNVWVKRGNFVLVEPIEEGDKVKAEIVRILNADHIKYLKKDNVWPAEFSDKKDESESDEDGLFVNRNRFQQDESESEEEKTDSD